MKRLACAALAVVIAAGMAGCVSNDPNRNIDYSKIGFTSDDGSR